MTSLGLKSGRLSSSNLSKFRCCFHPAMIAERYFMSIPKMLNKLSPVSRIILVAALVKFGLHLYMDQGFSFFFDEFYTIALSKHLAWGYVDLPPLVPALVALSRALLGESLLATHVFPALAGAGTLIFICLITREFGGKTFAVGLSAVCFILTPVWLGLDSIFCYDSIDQLVLAAFLFTLVRFLKSVNKKLWLMMGLLAGVACNAKMTILFLGPGFLLALLLSKYRRDLLSPWPWLGAGVCLLIVSPYLIWQINNQWPTLEYWKNYGAVRVYQASIAEYFNNSLIYMNGFLLPVWIAGLYRIFRRMNTVHYFFLGVLFLTTAVLLFFFHASIRMLAATFMPLLAAGALWVEEITARLRWKNMLKTVVFVYLLAVGCVIIPLTLPILPMDVFPAFAQTFKPLYQELREFNGDSTYYPILISGRLGWDDFVKGVGQVYNELPAEERKVAGVYTDLYSTAGAIDLLGPQYGLPHAVSGSLTYYFWGPGYSWDVMIIAVQKSNNLSMFFNQCELKSTIHPDPASLLGSPHIYVCRHPKISAAEIWSSLKIFR